MTAITIVALQDPIAFVHIPISSTDHSTRLYWTLEHASYGSSEFFNISSNCIEIAIFASVDLVNSQWIDPSLDPSIKISQSSWRVFEISSGDQGETGNYDSPHLRHVSASLAKAGITILYQSSYFTDFLLVKEVDFDKAAAIFAEQGWNVDRSAMSSPSRRRSQLLSPISPEPSPEPYFTSPCRSSSDHSLPPEITVLSSPLACIGFSRSAEGRTFEKIRQLVIWPRRAEVSWKRRSSTPDLETSLSDIPPTPTSSLPSAIARSFRQEATKNTRLFLSYTRTTDGSSLISSVKVLRDMFGAQKEGEVLELDEDVYFGDGDLFESSDESLRSGWEDESSDEEAGDPTSEDVAVSTPRMSPRRSPRHTSRSRPLSLPITPRDSPMAGRSTRDEIPIQWSSTESAEPSTLSPKRSKAGRVSWIEPAREDDSDTEGGVWQDDPRGVTRRKTGKGRKRCLQLDLRGIAEDESEKGEEVYHMDKSGLVTLFSNLLISANIRMLYSSTFHTANILVDAGDVRRAKKLLSSK